LRRGGFLRGGERGQPPMMVADRSATFRARLGLIFACNSFPSSLRPLPWRLIGPTFFRDID
jgi:hypothetical protein